MLYIKKFDNNENMERYIKNNFVSPHLFLETQNKSLSYLEKYKRLEYISSTQTGGQYINTGDLLFEEVADINIQIKYKIKGPGLICNTEDDRLFYTIFSCMYEAYPWPGIVLRILDRNGYHERSNQSNNTNPKINDLAYNSDINNIVELSYSFAINNDGVHNIPVYLFTSLNEYFNLQRMAEADLYYVKYYKNGNCVRNLIPVQRNSDNEVGLWDMEHQVFYTSQGDQPFVAGNIIE